MEGVKLGVYHVVDRQLPDPPYSKLCRYMLNLTGIKMREAWKGYHTKESSAEPE